MITTLSLFAAMSVGAILGFVLSGIFASGRADDLREHRTEDYLKGFRDGSAFKDLDFPGKKD